MTRIHDLEFYLSLRYRIELVPEDDGSWAALIPDLPGCVAAGATISEALTLLDDAREGWLTSRLKHGDPIPQPAPP